VRTLLSLATLHIRENLATQLDQSLRPAHMQLKHFSEFETFLAYVTDHRQSLDCLIVDVNDAIADFQLLRSQALFLPMLVLLPDHDPDASPSLVAPQPGSVSYHYHTAELAIEYGQIENVEYWINEAINRFIALSLDMDLAIAGSPKRDTREGEGTARKGISEQQRRLTDKLKERLGYLAVYYKRNPENFLRYLSSTRQKEFLDQLKLEYRQIILNYFTPDSALNQRIDHFVHEAFFADVPVAKVVELHIGLMDEFAKQLKLEGRSEEILLDYRLTLVDVLAHLCEMYRRSIPRES
jgi:circadian clock protein KaiA